MLENPRGGGRPIGGHGAKRGQSKSAVVREILDEYLSQGKPAAEVSCLDLAGDLIGCVEGPGDLSTNPRYMSGFGR